MYWICFPGRISDNMQMYVSSILGTKLSTGLPSTGNIAVFRGSRYGIYPPSRCSSLFGNCSNGDSDRDTFIATHNITLSHVTAFDLYRAKYQVFWCVCACLLHHRKFVENCYQKLPLINAPFYSLAKHSENTR